MTSLESRAPTTERDTPQHLRTSLAAAMVLGAQSGRFYRDVSLGCINLLLTYPEGCRANCAYCGLARGRQGDRGEESFIRVDWPTLATGDILDRMVRYQGDVRRVCLSMITHPRAYADTIAVARTILDRVRAPLSVLVAPNLLNGDRLKELQSIGVDMIGVGLDAASERVFQRTRGRGVKGPLSWSQYWQTIDEARRIFGPFRVNAHIVVGIGESDRELVDLLYRLRDMQVSAYLFSFYPEEGSPMARRRRPSLVRFRRVQLVKHLIERAGMELEQVGFDKRGRIAHMEVPLPILEEAISSGTPFLTGGCPDGDGDAVCTRPFGSYRPGEPFRDFPFQPTRDDLARVRRQLRWRDLLTPPAGLDTEQERHSE